MDWATQQLNICRQMILVAGITLALAGCSTTPSIAPMEGDAPANHSYPASRQEVIRIAGQLIGTPYRYGGNTPNGFDCSGLVQYTHLQVGIKVPRTTASQWAASHIPQRRHLLPGDLLFFSLGERKNRHVGIYEGSGLFIHAPSSGKQVSRASLDNPFWRRNLVATKTFL